MKTGFLAVALLIFSTALYAAELAKTDESAGEMINKATCSKGSDTRELEIVAKGDGHVVSYTKAGEVKEVATCSMTKTKCQAVFDQIKSKLESLGFTCKI